VRDDPCEALLLPLDPVREPPIVVERAAGGGMAARGAGMFRATGAVEVRALGTDALPVTRVALVLEGATAEPVLAIARSVAAGAGGGAELVFTKRCSRAS
jgi:hypothetical protein